MQQVVLATANLGKVAEITPVLAHVVELIPRPAHVPDVVEDAGTLLGNARLKAAALAEATGLPALADDTGVFIDALPDDLGVEAAHFGGTGIPYDQKNRLLLAALDGVPPERRTARFETVALLRWPGGGPELVAVGAVAGRIVAEPAGEEGWGFDPVFAPDEGDGRTFAQLGDAVKRAMSHRGRAFARLAWLLGVGAGVVIRPALEGASKAAGELWVAEAADAAGGSMIVPPHGPVVVTIDEAWADRGIEDRFEAIASQRSAARTDERSA
jgi:XTP/dITP diphosphohydrolase